MTPDRDLVPSAAHCVYVTDGGIRRCNTPAVGVYPRGHYPDWPLCAEHAQQKHHPADVDMSRFETTQNRETRQSS